MQPSRINPQIIYPYDPRFVPLPAPVHDVFDEPSIMLCINAEWASHLDGLLERLLYFDAWDGTDEERERAIGQVWRLLASLGGKNMGCCCNDNKVTIHRLNPVTGAPEVSTDGGVVWTPDPESIYTKAVEAKPLDELDTELLRCKAANQVVGEMQRLQGVYSGYIGTIEDVEDFAITIITEVVAILLTGIVGVALLPLVVALIPKILQTIRALVSMTQEEYDALFIGSTWATALCIVYCSTPDDGEYTEAQWLTIQSQLRSKLGTTDETAGASLAGMVDVWGLVGLKNASRIGQSAGLDCDECSCSDEWWFEFDFTTAAFNRVWHQFAVNQGHYVAGEGYAPDVPIDIAQLVIAADFTTYDGLDLIGYIVEQQGATVTNYNRGVFFNATRDNYDGNLVEVIDANERWIGEAGGALNVTFFAPQWVGPAAGGGSDVRLTRVVLHGKGINPFGVDNYVYNPLSP